MPKIDNSNAPLFVSGVYSIIFSLESLTEVNLRGSFPDTELTKVFKGRSHSEERRSLPS